MFVAVERSAVSPAEASEARHDLESLYRAFAGDVARWASRLGGAGFDAEDAVHEVFLIVRDELVGFRGDAKVTTWLYGITSNVVRHQRRRSKVRRWLGIEPEPDYAPLAEAELLAREESRTVYRVLDNLSEKYRTVLILHEFEELSGPEISELTGVAVSTVWVRLHRARRLFLEAYERDRTRTERRR
ncbi:MAG: RNA polymerase sigma factor [Deltaproteobacteria bacterium]|nr:RNA polymerase sigma factor [Deltaproteobacteria bacterium]